MTAKAKYVITDYCAQYSYTLCPEKKNKIIFLITNKFAATTTLCCRMKRSLYTYIRMPEQTTCKNTPNPEIQKSEIQIHNC